jgi:valyl-tRNA synthetase
VRGKEQKVRITPPRYAKSYLDWLGEKRDWCISRNLWWGHRIPVWAKNVRTKSQLSEYIFAIQNHSRYQAGELDYLVDDQPEQNQPQHNLAPAPGRETLALIAKQGPLNSAHGDQPGARRDH